MLALNIVRSAAKQRFQRRQSYDYTTRHRAY